MGYYSKDAPDDLKTELDFDKFIDEIVDNEKLRKPNFGDGQGQYARKVVKDNAQPLGSKIKWKR